ncbi:MAG: response regulator transcription factor [Clostridia bacterium]|nr:response regulator transcription factor [Clostridia bacterium]
MSAIKIMVVDDDSNIGELLRLYLSKEGYEPIVLTDGEQAVEQFDTVQPDLILLDVMMPKLDGWQVCRRIRKKSQCPIIMLTAKGELFDKVLGLDLGADDYIVKPFETKEVIARVKAVLRRAGVSQGEKAKEVSYDGLYINMENYELRVNGKRVDTPPKEMELIYHLASNPNRVYTRDQLLDEVWGFEYYGDSRTVDVHIKRLREKLEGASEQWTLKTVWSVGYKFELKESDI